MLTRQSNMSSFYIDNILGETSKEGNTNGSLASKAPVHCKNNSYDSDEEYDSSCTVPRWRKKFTEKQRNCLEQVFKREKYLTVKQREALAKEINLTTQQVKTWYQNRRTKWKKEQYTKALRLTLIGNTKSGNCQWTPGIADCGQYNPMHQYQHHCVTCSDYSWRKMDTSVNVEKGREFYHNTHALGQQPLAANNCFYNHKMEHWPYASHTLSTTRTKFV